MDYQPRQDMPDYWLSDCKTEEEVEKRKYEWEYYQCQKNRDYFRVQISNMLRNQHGETVFNKSVKDGDKANN